MTAPASLLDATGRRIVVEDATGAIEVLLPKDVPAPGVGTRIRPTGRVGARVRCPAAPGGVDGAARLREASRRRCACAGRSVRHIPGGSSRCPVASTTCASSGTVGVPRSWSERLTWSSSASPARGSRSRPSSRAARSSVIGHRPAGLPERHRSPPDDPAPVAAATSASAADRRTAARRAGHRRGGRRDRRRRGGAVAASGGMPERRHQRRRPSPMPTSPTSHPSSVTTVRVGGLVVDVRPDGFVLDDGTAHAPVVLRDEAADWIPLIEPEDAINVIGRVERLDDGSPRRGRHRSRRHRARQRPDRDSAYGGPHRRARQARRRRRWPAAARPRSAGFGDDLGASRAPEPASRHSLGISLASLGVTLLRRRQARRLLAARVAARLSAIGGPRRPSMSPSADRRTGPWRPPRPARRRAERGLERGPSVGRAWPDRRHPRSATLDSRTNRGLSSAEFRASEAAT